MGTVLVQRLLLRGIIPPSTVLDWTVRVWDNLEELPTIEASLPDGPVLVHGSLQAASLIRRKKDAFPKLFTGVVLPQDSLTAHALQGLLGDVALNQRALYAPFGALADMEDVFTRALGPSLFVRPDTSLKVFSGRPIPAGEWAREIHAIQSIDRPDPDCLCQVAPVQTISQPEWRCWCVEGEVVACAPYSFDAPVDCTQPIPNDLKACAQIGAQRMLHIDGLMVIDVTYNGDGLPKVIEANGFSTSGFYPGVDLHALWAAASQMWV